MYLFIIMEENFIVKYRDKKIKQAQEFRNFNGNLNDQNKSIVHRNNLCAKET